MVCVKAGYQQRIIHESAWNQLNRIESCEDLVVGVNSHQDHEDLDFEGLVINPGDDKRQISKLIELRKNRNQELIGKKLSELRDSCNDGSNIMEKIISAVKAEATIGEINNIMREEFGTWVAPSGV